MIASLWDQQDQDLRDRSDGPNNVKRKNARLYTETTAKELHLATLTMKLDVWYQWYLPRNHTASESVPPKVTRDAVTSNPLPRALDTVNNLGNLYSDQGWLDEAEGMYNRALQGFERALGSSHLKYQMVLQNLQSLK